MTLHISIDVLAWIIRVALALAVSLGCALALGRWLDRED